MEGTTTIRGTATISLKTLDELRAKAEEAETEKKRSDWFVKKLMNCYGFDTEAYDKALKEIDNERNLTDKQCSKLVREAMVKHLKIVIDPEELKELIQEYIDEEASGHCESKYEGAETDSGGTERVVIPAENVDIVDKSSDTETKEDK